MADDTARDERAQQHDIETPMHTEHTPLLARDGDDVQVTEQSRPQAQRSASSMLFSRLKAGGKGAKRRWPSLLALLALCIVAVLIMIFAFLAPSIVEQYANQAVTFEPTSLSIVGFTSSGVQAKVEGDFMLDGSKVEPKSVRDLGRFGTWIAHKAESGESTVEVSLPEYGNLVLGTARVPPIIVDLRDGKVTHVEFITDLWPGEFEGLRRLASDWIDGRLGQLRVVGKADVPIKSGIFSLGTQKVIHELLFHNKDIPTMPAYKIKKLNVHEVEVESGTAMAADVSLTVENPYPVELTVPPMSFDILVNGCQAADPNILVADATTHELVIQPKKNVRLDVTGLVRTLPEVLTAACPDSADSPLDILIGSYIRGKKTTIFVKGAENSTAETPDWVKQILSSITVPVDVPSKGFGKLIKNMSTTDTHFSLPDPWAEPGTPAASPKISALLIATVALPEEMNFNVSAEKVRAHAKVYYKKRQLGLIDIDKWLPAKSTREPAESEDDGPTLLVEARLKDVPVNITDDDLLTDVIQELILGSGDVLADLKAKVDVGVNTALGSFAVRNIPADGQVPIKPITSRPPSSPHNGTSPADMLNLLHPRIYNISVESTTPTSLTISALVNITNPTDYTASIPYLSLHALTNDSTLANISVSNVQVRRGNNTGLKAVATWNPLKLGGGQSALEAGVLLLSQYISGYNTTITLQPHAGSIPALPGLSRALAKFNVTIPTPRLPSSSPPDNDEDSPDGPKFIDQARFHLFSSTADFILRSPLLYDTMVITYINATADYKDSKLGQIEYDEPFEVEPIDKSGVGSLTPRLPVDWETGSVGWDAVRRAIGGRLKIAASAVIDIAVGEWRLAGIHFEGHGLGVGVRP